MVTLRAVYLFIRFPALSYTALLPLLGAGSVSPAFGVGHLLPLLAVAVMFHTFAYVINDLVDLPLDRTERWRADYPLVRRSITPDAALAVALLQVPGAFVTTWLMEWAAEAHVMLLTALSMMTVYNLWGKRCTVPLLTDAVQGVAWAAFVLYGAWTVGEPGVVSWLLSAHAFVFTVMINGVHGSLRDLANDWRCRARTTAIYLGARPAGESGIVLPRRFVAYVLVLQGAVVGITLMRLLHPWTGEPDGLGAVVPAVAMALTVLSLALPLAALRSLHDGPTLGVIGTLHLLLSQAVLALMYGAPLGGMVGLTVLVVFTVPILAMWAHNGATWG